MVKYIRGKGKATSLLQMRRIKIHLPLTEVGQFFTCCKLHCQQC